VLTFTRTKHRANRLADFLARHDVSVDRIHGNRSQAQRTQALAAFKDGKVRVLVATDIAARGIDITALSHVVNFDVPAVPEDYIHRSGRTARAEAEGDSVTFVSPDEEGSPAIERAIGRPSSADAARFDWRRAAERAYRGAAGRAERRRPRPEGPQERGGAVNRPQRAGRPDRSQPTPRLDFERHRLFAPLLREGGAGARGRGAPPHGHCPWLCLPLLRAGSAAWAQGRAVREPR
jgi:ATP-dependent RNA helicase RhlE